MTTGLSVYQERHVERGEQSNAKRDEEGHDRDSKSHHETFGLWIQESSLWILTAQ